MSTAPRLSDLARGEVVGTRTVTFTRADLVAYAGASGDRNPIHWSPTFAEHVGPMVEFFRAHPDVGSAAMV